MLGLLLPRTCDKPNNTDTFHLFTHIVAADDSYTIPQQPEIELIVANQSKKVRGGNWLQGAAIFLALADVDDILRDD